MDIAPLSLPLAGRDGEHTGGGASCLGRSNIACSGLHEYNTHRVFKDKIILKIRSSYLYHAEGTSFPLSPEDTPDDVSLGTGTWGWGLKSS